MDKELKLNDKMICLWGGKLHYCRVVQVNLQLYFVDLHDPGIMIEAEEAEGIYVI